MTDGRLDSLRQSFRFMRGNILVLSVTDAFGNFCRRMVFPYGSLYILALGGDPGRVGLVNALLPLAGLVILPLGGYIADHVGRVKLVVLANYLQALIMMVYLLAHRWEMVALAMLLLGGVAVQFPASSSLIADSLNRENRGKGFATMMTITGALAIFAPYLGGRTVDVYGANTGMRILYAVMMAASVTSATIQLRFLRESGSRPREGLALSAVPGMLRSAYAGVPATLRRLPRSLKALAGVIILIVMSNGVASPYWVVYAVDEIGLSSSQWGLVLLIELALQNLLFIPAGVIVDRYGRTRALLAALLLALVAIPLFVSATGFLAVLAIRAAVAMAFVTTMPACTALLADTVPSDMRGRVMAALGHGGVMVGAAGGGTGGPAVGFLVTIPLIISLLGGGYLYELHPRYPWYLVGLMMALCVVLTVLFIRDSREAQA